MTRRQGHELASDQDDVSRNQEVAFLAFVARERVAPYDVLALGLAVPGDR